MRLVAITIGGIAVLSSAAIAGLMILSGGHEGVLIRSTAGRFTAETNVYSDKLARNFQAVGFRKCDYFSGVKVFTTVGGPSCPWYMSDKSAVTNIREGID
jgi:hypothetical protein